MSGGDGTALPSKKSKVLSFVHKVSESFKAKNSTPRHDADDEDDTLGSPGAGSTNVVCQELPEGKVLLDRIVQDGKDVIKISPSLQFIHDASPDPSRWFGEIFRNHSFTDFYPTAKTLSNDVYKLWFTQFQRDYSCPGFTEKQINTAFKEMITKCYRANVHAMHKKWKANGKTPTNYPPHVWAKWEAHWRSSGFQKNSYIAKTNRNSNEGQGSVHTGGSINHSESWNRLVKRHGPEVDAAEAFLATHTSVAPDGTRKWVSSHYKEIYETYVERAREDAIEKGIMEPESTEFPPFRGELWKAICIQNKRQRGDRLPGFGEHGACFFDDLPLSNRSSLSFSSSNSQNMDYDAEMRHKDDIIASLTETLNTQVNTQVEQMREEMEQQMHQKMQEMMRSMLQHQTQQPSSGNNSNSSIGPYLNLNGSGRRGGRGGVSTSQSRRGGNG